MADKSTIYKARLHLSDVDRDCYQQFDLTLACHPSETRQRLVARLLAYALCYEEELAFTKGICEGETPDIWLQRPGEKMSRWIEVGQPSPERLETACKRAGEVTLFLYGKRRERWLQANLDRLTVLTNLTIIPLSDELLDSLSGNLKRSLEWSVTVTDGMLYLDSDGANHQEQLTPCILSNG
ncbi:MAG: YaeQ family protein [Candidatus Sedimenticola sp. 20ELBAFRAG]